MNTIRITKIEEAAKPKGKAFLLTGKFSPYTIGHHEVARDAAAHAAASGYTHFYHGIGGAGKQTESDPFTHAQKTKVIRAAHRELAKAHPNVKFRTTKREQLGPFHQLTHLAKQGHKHITVALAVGHKLKNEIGNWVKKNNGIKDETGKVHPVKVDFHQLGAERQEGEMPRHEVLSKLRGGDIRVAKATRLRNAVKTGDTELAHELMPKHMNKPKYFGMIKSAQSKIAKPKKKLTEGLLSFSEFIAEAPELDAYIDAPSGRKHKFGSDYLKSKESTYHLHTGHKFLKHENLGEIHPGYELHRHVSSVTGLDRGKPVHVHQYSIVHKKSGDVAGEIDASAGKIHRKTGEHTRGTGKGLAIKWVGVHPEHSSKKAGTSLPIAAYKHLHKLGHSIKSDTTHSFGGAHVWDRLRKDPDVKHHVKYHDEKDNRAVPAHKLDYGDIWQEHESGQETTLVLHAKPKKKVVTEDIELIPVTRDRDTGKPRKAAAVHKDYGSKTYSSDKVVARKNLGEIHPGYELHQHSVEMDNTRPSGPQRVLKHKFTIVHKASGDIAGEMHAWGGKLHPKKGVVFGAKGKALKVSHLEMHPDHSSKKVGASLPVEMYRHLHRRGHAIQSDSVQSHGGAHVWNTMRNDRELKKHMMIHDDDKTDTKQKHAFQTRAHKRPERHIWHQFSRSWSGGRDNPSKVEPEYGVDPDFRRTLILAGKKRKKKTAVVSEDIEMADILVKPKSGGLSPRNFEKMVAHKGLKPKRSGRIAKGYTLYTSTDKENPEFQDHHIVHDATGHVAGEVSTRTSGNNHEVIHTDVHGDHTQKVIGKSLAVLAYKHLAKKKGNLHSSSLQSPGGASIWNRLRKDPKMKGQVFHKMRGQAEVPAHDLPDKKIWATDVKGGMSSSNKDIPKPLPPSKHHAAEAENVMGSRLVIRPIKKTKYTSTKTGETK